MIPSDKEDRSGRLSRLRAQVGNGLVDQLLRAHAFDPGLPSPPDLLRAMEEVESWIPSVGAPVSPSLNDIERVAPVQFFSDNCPTAIMKLSEALQEGAGASADDDDAASALVRLGARAYPALLAETEDNLSAREQTWTPMSFRRWNDTPPPSEYSEATKALREDRCLDGLYEPGAVGLKTTFESSNLALRLYDPVELILHGAWRLALLRGSWDAVSFRTAILEQLERVRGAARGESVIVPIFCGFSRANIDVPLEVGGDVFRPYVGSLQNSLIDPVDRLDGSYHAAGFVVERAHSWRYLSIRGADTNKSAETHDLGALDWSGVRHWANYLAVAAAAVQVGDKLKPHDLQHPKAFSGIPELLWIETADPLWGASSAHLSRDWTWHDDDAPNLDRATLEYARELENVSDDSFKVAIRRVRMALDQPRRWEDALVDSVIAWEALSGKCFDGVTLMTTGFLAKLISAPSHRHQIRSDLKTLYGQRNRVVHGGALDGADVRRWKDQAITAALIALKQLGGHHRGLLGHEDRFERLCLDHDDPLGSSSSGNG